MVPRVTHPAVQRWLPRLALVAVIACVTFWVHLFEFRGENRWDSAAFLAISKLLQQGLLLYRDLWDTKPPGIYLYQGTVFSVLPTAVWSLRLTDYILYVAAGLVFFRLCRIEARWPLALAGTVVWLYLSHHPSFNIAGFYTEEYSSICAIAAVAAAARYWRGGPLLWAVASGVAAAVAVIFKHPGIACAVPAAVLLCARRPLRSLPLAALCGALPLLLVVGYFWLRGALDAFLDCQFLHLLTQHGLVADPHPKPFGVRVQELGVKTYAQLLAYPALLWPAAFGSIVCLARPNRFRLAVLLWLLLDLILIGVQRFYYEHYFIQLFPSATLAGVIGAAWLLQARPHERWYIAAPRLAACVAIAWLVWVGANDVVVRRRPVLTKAWAVLSAGPAAWPQRPGGVLEEEVGRYMRDRTDPDERIFIYETGTGLAAFWSAERLPASRYIFSIVPQASLARQAEQIAELERNRPAYVAITGNWAYRYFTPFLLNNYTLAAVKWGEYRVELWVRNETAPLDAGVMSGLAADPPRNGLVLAQPQAPSDAPLVSLPSPQRGTWTSPVIDVVGGDGELTVDWNPRHDLAANPRGAGLPSAQGSVATTANSDANALLGAPTRTGRWSTFPRPSPQSVTLRFGFQAVADRVVVRGVLGPGETAADRFTFLAGDGDALAPLDGEWESGANGAATFRFAPRALSALQVVATPLDGQRAVGLERVQVEAVGMGVAVRYRTGPTANLDDAPWIAVKEEEGQRMARVQRYVQIQADVWSSYEGRSPVLRSLQIGRLRFQLDGGAPRDAPLRTARAPGAALS